MSKTQFIVKYLYHCAKAKNTKGHGIHSPFLFRFTQNVVYNKNPYYYFSEIESVRKELLKDPRILSFVDLGTGKNREITVQQIAKISAKRPKIAQLLSHLVKFVNATTVMELGTSLGISTAYLAAASPNISCITFEGSKQVMKIAQENFKKLHLDNIEIVAGNINETLQPRLNKLAQKLDVVFFDANHRKKPVLDYFTKCLEHIHDESVFIFDDIHWSVEMEEAWEIIRKHPSVSATFDLYEIGIVFFNKQFQKKTFKMALSL